MTDGRFGLAAIALMGEGENGWEVERVGCLDVVSQRAPCNREREISLEPLVSSKESLEGIVDRRQIEVSQYLLL